MLTKPEIKQILFATDLSENANRALSYAASLADAYGASITVLHVLEKLPPQAEQMLVAYLGYSDVDELKQANLADLINQIKIHIEQFCGDTAQEFPECRFIFHNTIVEPGKAADRILHHTSSDSYDALVIGSRGHGSIQEALMGGTANKVLHKCSIPVFVVPL